MNHKAMSMMVVMVGFFLSGCASIMTGSSQQVTFNSNPEGSTVNVGGRPLGKTPLTTSLKRKTGQAIVFEKEGYKPVSMELETRTNGWFWGNILIGGLVGSTTDGLSGAVNEYSPSQYLVTLQPDGSGRIETQTSLSEKQKVVQFIVTGYKDLVSELAKGEGVYLSSLLTSLKVAEPDKAATIERIKKLSVTYPNIPEFADQVADAYLPADDLQKTPAAAPAPSNPPAKTDGGLM